ncbi:hypothetical protein [Thiomonas sp.]
MFLVSHQGLVFEGDQHLQQINPKPLLFPIAFQDPAVDLLGGASSYVFREDRQDLAKRRRAGRIYQTSTETREWAACNFPALDSQLEIERHRLVRPAAVYQPFSAGVACRLPGTSALIGKGILTTRWDITTVEQLLDGVWLVLSQSAPPQHWPGETVPLPVPGSRPLPQTWCHATTAKEALPQ